MLAKVLLGLTVGLASSCASQEVRPVEPLPFHVAMIPTNVFERPASATDAATEEDQDTTEYPLTLEREAVAKALLEVLDGYCFARTTLLAYPDDMSAEAFGALDIATRNKHWVERANEAKADILLETRLSYAPSVRTDTNDKFWLNFPLFLLGGPMVWWVDDRSYYMDASLRANLYDVPPMVNPLVEAQFRADLDNNASRLMRLDISHNEAAFDFVDRADGNIGDYALSMLIPSGFVATDTAAVLAHLQQDIVENMARRLVDGVQTGRMDLIQPEQGVRFWPEGVAITRHPNGTRSIRGDVVLEAGLNVDGMREFTVRAPGMTAARQHFDDYSEEQSGGHSYQRYELDYLLPKTLEAGYVQVEFVDRADNVRTLTLPIDGITPIAKPIEAVYRPATAAAADA